MIALYNSNMLQFQSLDFNAIPFQTTASESTFVALLAARTEAIRKYKSVDPEVEDAEINARLVAYCSDQVQSLLLVL